MKDELAARLLAHIRADLIELEGEFGIDDDLFAAGLDSMAIMQLTLLLEEKFGTKLPDRLIKRETFGSARRLAAAIREVGSQ